MIIARFLSELEPERILSANEKDLLECFRRAARIAENPYLDPSLAGSDAFLFRSPPPTQPSTRNFEGFLSLSLNYNIIIIKN